jgi:hypothetical protein
MLANKFSNSRYLFLFVLVIVTIFLTVGCLGAPSEDVVPNEVATEEPMDDTVISELALSFVDAANSKKIDDAMANLADNITFNFGEQDTLNSKDSVQSWLTEMFGQNQKIKVENVEVVNNVVKFQTSVTRTSLQKWHIDSLNGMTKVMIEGDKIIFFDFQLDEDTLAMLPAPIESTDELVGDWQRAKSHPGMGEIFLRFTSENTYRQAIGEAEKLDSSPMVEGIFEFEAGMFVITNEIVLNENYLWGCEESTMIGEYTISRLSNDNIILEVVDDECHGRDDNIAAEYKPVE